MLGQDSIRLAPPIRRKSNLEDGLSCLCLIVEVGFRLRTIRARRSSNNSAVRGATAVV